MSYSQLTTEQKKHCIYDLIGIHDLEVNDAMHSDKFIDAAWKLIIAAAVKSNPKFKDKPEDQIVFSMLGRIPTHNEIFGNPMPPEKFVDHTAGKRKNWVEEPPTAGGPGLQNFIPEGRPPQF